MKEGRHISAFHSIILRMWSLSSWSKMAALSQTSHPHSKHQDRKGEGWCITFILRKEKVLANTRSSIHYFYLHPIVYNLSHGFPTSALLAFGPDNSLLWKAILRTVGCLGAFLPASHQMPGEHTLTQPELWQNVPTCCYNSRGRGTSLADNHKLKERWQISKYYDKVGFCILRQNRKMNVC